MGRWEETLQGWRPPIRDWMTKGPPAIQQDQACLGIHGCPQCIGSLRFDWQPMAGQGGKQKLSRTGDKLRAAGGLMMPWRRR